MYQVGLEFETPQNVWEVEQRPEDWDSFPSSSDEDFTSLLGEVERLLQLAQVGAHYELLGLQPDALRSEVKRQFYHLASRFHPDHHMEHPEWTPQLLKLMDSLTLAYKTLSDEDSKKRYDSLVGNTPRQELTDSQQLALECLQNANECLTTKNYIGSIVWLRRVIEAEPHSSGYRTMLGRSLAAVPEYRHEAAEQFEKAIELDPSHIAAHYEYGRLLELMNFPWRARPYYLRILELDANHPEARERLNHLAASPRSVSGTSLLDRLTHRR